MTNYQIHSSCILAQVSTHSLTKATRHRVTAKKVILVVIVTVVIMIATMEERN